MNLYGYKYSDRGRIRLNGKGISGSRIFSLADDDYTDCHLAHSQSRH